ncbi:hypothetical protein BT69DRAFT_1295844 [Atractiella rhizophila]|nr:hypothetical protein BT69DRAFT_1295844 [Atractiella rhizophila]
MISSFLEICQQQVEFAQCLLLSSQIAFDDYYAIWRNNTTYQELISRLQDVTPLYREDFLGENAASPIIALHHPVKVVLTWLLAVDWDGTREKEDCAKVDDTCFRGFQSRFRRDFVQINLTPIDVCISQQSGVLLTPNAFILSTRMAAQQNPLTIFRTAIAGQLSKIIGVEEAKVFEGVDIGGKRGDFSVAVPRFRLKEKPDEIAKRVVEQLQWTRQRWGRIT